MKTKAICGIILAALAVAAQPAAAGHGRGGGGHGPGHGGWHGGWSGHRGGHRCRGGWGWYRPAYAPYRCQVRPRLYTCGVWYCPPPAYVCPAPLYYPYPYYGPVCR